MSLQETPRGERPHIGFFGRRNSGKSSLLNRITGQNAAIVSAVPGTTTDTVSKAMELHPAGPVMFLDTAGFDDEGPLGELRIRKTEEALEKTDLAVMVFDCLAALTGDAREEAAWRERLGERRVPVIVVLNKKDRMAPGEKEAFAGQKDRIESRWRAPVHLVSAGTGEGIDALREEIIRKLPEPPETAGITDRYVKAGDTVLLVMPQDIQAPRGRLILPQVQTIRSLLDNRCLIVSTGAGQLEEALGILREPPALIITDSQCFPSVYEKKPAQSRLTSFSVLFAAYKGAPEQMLAGARHLNRLPENSRILIAEACTHAPLEEDIGREKIPALLRKRTGEKIRIEFCAGDEYPEDLSHYDLIIHCGGCMINRSEMLSRISRAERQNVPVTNYGLAIAALSGILDRIYFPFGEAERR